MTLADHLERAASFPETGLRFLDRDERATWWPWPALHAAALRACGSLRSLGVRPGERVALVYPTCPEFVVALFGTLLSGAVPVPLYPPVRLGRLEEYRRRTSGMLAASQAVLVLAGRRVRRLLGEVIQTAGTPLGCLTLGDLPGDGPGPLGAGAGDLALVQFSSGTTLDPKPVALTHRAVVAQAALLNRLWPDGPGVRHSGVSWLPLYHDMGLIGCIFTALERPGSVTLLPPEAFLSRPALWLRAISRYRATISPAPNFAYGLCVDRVREDDLEGVDLSCWRIAPCGAETVVARVLAAFRERFGHWGLRPETLTPVYGLSEAALAVTFSDPGSPATVRSFSRAALAERGEARDELGGREIVSVGRALPGFGIRILDRDGRVLPDGRVGRIEVSGPSLMEGYLDRPVDSARVLRDGWLDTGDLGFLLRGELYLTGRAKDMLLLRGRSHAPEEVERAVDGLPGVRTGCAVAASWLPEGDDGERLLLLVEARRGIAAAEFEALARRCSEAVVAATGLAPDRAVILEAGTLPRTSSGKLRRAEALRLYLAGALRPPAPATALRLGRAVARSAVAYARRRWRSGFGTD